MLGRILGAVIGREIDRSDGRGGAKGAILGAMAPSMLRRTGSIGLALGGAWLAKRYIDRRRATAPR